MYSKNRNNGTPNLLCHLPSFQTQLNFDYGPDMYARDVISMYLLRLLNAVKNLDYWPDILIMSSGSIFLDFKLQ